MCWKEGLALEVLGSLFSGQELLWLSLCHSRTYNRIWSPRFAASWLWKLVGEGSRHNWSVTSGEGLALRVGDTRLSDLCVPCCASWGFILKVCSFSCCAWVWVKCVAPKPAQNWSGQRESDCLIKTKHCDIVETIWHNVISAQCSECQFGEIQLSAGQRRE